MSEISWNSDGLAPAVVQDPESGRVLMLGWMTPKSLELTRSTGRVHFWSRSRQELWEKGATSGNYLDVVDIAVDCDNDAILVTARPEGPTCHTGTATCWGDRPGVGLGALADLWETIRSRTRELPSASYTTSLIKAGPEGIGRKVVEEATEVLLAAKDHQNGIADSRRVAEESADLIYHLMVLMAERGVTPSEIMEVLDERSR